ncbi:MAG: hypothetical protein WC943_15505 [Elusimicrobiota bacterium]|jgi:hypothetical protein
MADKDKSKRFDFLEGKKAAGPSGASELPQVGRFEHLEIGGERRPTPGPKTEAQPQRVLCGRCGQPNEAERETCWACYKPLALKAGARSAPAPDPAKPGQGQDITLVIDGLTYRSNDPNLPPDIRGLMDRISSEGFSQSLLDAWRSEREQRSDPGHTREIEGRASGDERVSAFKGARVSVIRLDGKVYLSDAPDLPPRIRELFGYIDRNGVTPQLMENLRAMGTDARVRPSTTAAPSDGDLAFWREVEESRRRERRARTAGEGGVDAVLRSFYYLAPAWFFVETALWPFFRAGLVTGGGVLGSLLFYTVEAAIGAGYWWGLPWIRHAALAENLFYIGAAMDIAVLGPLTLVSRLESGGAASNLAAGNFHRSIPGFLFSVFFVIFTVRRLIAERSRR